MNNKLVIITCPTCGNDKIRLVVKDVTRKYTGQTYTVPAAWSFTSSQIVAIMYSIERLFKN
jgi:hypothetical protein